MAIIPTGTTHLNINPSLFGEKIKYQLHSGIQIIAAVGLMMQEKAAKLRALTTSLALFSFFISQGQ